MKNSAIKNEKVKAAIAFGENRAAPQSLLQAVHGYAMLIACTTVFIS